MKETKESTIKEESFGTKVSESFTEGFSKKFEEEVEKLKNEFFQKAESIAISEDQKESIQGMLEDAIKQAYAFGKASETDFSDITSAAAEKIENLYRQMTEPTAATRADKYKQLYYNQRIITAHMQSQIQILQTQIQTMESDGNLFTSIIERMPSIFGAPPVMERIDTAFAPANT